MPSWMDKPPRSLTHNPVPDSMTVSSSGARLSSAATPGVFIAMTT